MVKCKKRILSIRYTVSAKNTVVGTFTLSCAVEPQIPTWNFISVEPTTEVGGSFVLMDLYGKKIFGGSSSTLDKALTGTLIAPGQYLLGLYSTSERSATFTVIIETDIRTYTVNNGSPVFRRIDVSGAKCTGSGETTGKTSLGLRQTTKCSTGLVGSKIFECRLKGDSAGFDMVSSSCVLSKKMSYLHYGVSTIKVTVNTALTLTPKTDGDYES